MLKRKIFKILVVIVCVIFLFAFGFYTGFDLVYRLNRNFGPISERIAGNSRSAPTVITEIDRKVSLKPVEEAIEFIFQNAINSFSRQELVNAAIEGILAHIGDKYAEYYSKEDFEALMESYSGTMSGIGVVVTLDEEERVVVISVIEDAPASKQDIMPGDVITRVNGEDISGFSLEMVVSLIKGPSGTEVTITIFRPEENRTFEVTIRRAQFYVPNLYSEMIEENIAYIRYVDFQDKGAENLDEEIASLIDEGAQVLIFDLRNNLGGILSDAINVCDLFMDEGVIATVKSRDEGEEKVRTYNATKGKYTEIPVIVLINQFSASSSELVAGTLQDSERAVLIGVNSLGKGSVQTLNVLSDGSGIKFTMGKYFTSGGNSIEEGGIAPDIFVDLDLAAEQDFQLNRAIEEAKKAIN